MFGEREVTKVVERKDFTVKIGDIPSFSLYDSIEDLSRIRAKAVTRRKAQRFKPDPVQEKYRQQAKKLVKELNSFSTTDQIDAHLNIMFLSRRNEAAYDGLRRALDRELKALSGKVRSGYFSREDRRTYVAKAMDNFHATSFAIEDSYFDPEAAIEQELEITESTSTFDRLYSSVQGRVKDLGRWVKRNTGLEPRQAVAAGLGLLGTLGGVGFATTSSYAPKETETVETYLQASQGDHEEETFSLEIDDPEEFESPFNDALEEIVASGQGELLSQEQLNSLHDDAKYVDHSSALADALASYN